MRLLTLAIAALVVPAASDPVDAQLSLPPPPPGVQTSTEFGIEFSRVDSAGNAAHDPTGFSPYQNFVTPFGAVAYQYRIARAEVTTGQWLQFVNTFAAQPDFPTSLFGYPSFVNGPPVLWGGTEDPSYGGPGVRFRLNPNKPNAANLPVGGITWRSAALYANWLNSGQSSDLNGLWSGAYDTTMFSLGAAGFTDQRSHSANARFWIPSGDEWAKAVYFNPNKNGPGNAGYWQFPISSDTAPVYGPPGIGQANSGYSGVGPDDPWLVPLASYLTQQTPWGLLDAAGGASEWTAWVGPASATASGFFSRGLMGSFAEDAPGGAVFADRLGNLNTFGPNSLLPFAGLRIAGAVPSPGCAVFALASVIPLARRKRRIPSSTFL